MHARQVAKLAYVDLQNLRTPAAKRNRVFRQFLRKPIHFRSAATAAVAAFAVRLGCSVVILAFRFLRMAECRSRTIERLCLSQRHLDDRVDEFEELAIGRFPVEIVSLVADGITLAAFHPVIVVVQDFLERPAINYSLVSLETFAL